MIVVLSTAPDVDLAVEIARTLVEERLAACVNVVPGLRSIYRWQGKACDETEVLCVIKTSRDRFADLEARLRKLHPYELPEIVALPVALGHKPYLDWVRQST
jgi:periplasmic divalent cation tolerance protein